MTNDASLSASGESKSPGRNNKSLFGFPRFSIASKPVTWYVLDTSLRVLVPKGEKVILPTARPAFRQGLVFRAIVFGMFRSKQACFFFKFYSFSGMLEKKVIAACWVQSAFCFAFFPIRFLNFCCRDKTYLNRFVVNLNHVLGVNGVSYTAVLESESFSDGFFKQ
jgi:hypothetical protein